MTTIHLSTYFFALIFSVLFTSSCGKDDDDVTTANAWTEIQKNAFIKTCTTGSTDTPGLTESKCTCIYDETIKEYSYSDYQKLTTAQLSSMAIKTGLTCALK